MSDDSGSNPLRCVRCGNALTTAVTDGLCPRCLARAIFDEPDTAAEELAPPGELRRVGDYELREFIARGGMGVVYRAVQNHLGREVAVKILLDSVLISEAERARFRAEATTAAGLQHPGIVAIHEIGEEQGRCFFSMDFIEGSDLGAMTRQHPLPTRQAAELTAKIAVAVQHAHAHGVLHRDLKPSNVLVDAAGEPHITDFGLAKRLPTERAAASANKNFPAEQTAHLTLTGQIVGTPGYMSPEQARAQRELGPATDIYSLGALLYHLLTARAPFVGESPAAVLRQLEENEPVAPHLLNPSVPRDLETICLKCLDKEPTRRYASAANLAADLNRFLRHEPIRARPAAPLERVWRWCRRKPALAALVGVALASLAAVAVVTALARVRLDEQRAEVRRKDYIADMQLVNFALQEKNLGLASRLLDKWRPARPTTPAARTSPREDLRHFEWHYFNRLAQGDEILTLRHGEPPVRRVAFSPDGHRLATSSAAGEVCLWDLESQQLIARAGHDKRILALAFSSDGRRIATGSDDQKARLWDGQTLQPLGDALAHTAALVTVSFSADGQTLATVSRNETTLWDVAQTTPLSRQPLPKTAWFYGAISPSQRLLALPLAGDRVRLLDFATHQQRAALGELSSATAFSADEKLLATGEFRGTARVWELASLREITTIAAHEGGVGGLAFSPDGRQLATAGRDQLVKLWELPSGRLLGTWRGHRGAIYSVAFSPDGSKLATASADATVKIWNTTAPVPVQTPAVESLALALTHASPAAPLARLPDGRWAKLDLNQSPPVTVPLPALPTDTNLVFACYRAGIVELSASKQVRFYDTSGQFLRAGCQLPANSDGLFSISAAGRWLATYGETNGLGRVAFWDVNTGAAVIDLSAGESWILPTFSPQQPIAAAATIEGEIAIVNLASGKIEKRFRGHRGVVTDICFSRDGQWLVTSAVDGLARMWRVSKLDSAPWEFDAGVDAIWCVCLSPDGKRLAGAADNGRVFIWDVATQLVVARLRAPDPGLLFQLYFSTDGNILLALTEQRAYSWRTR